MTEGSSPVPEQGQLVQVRHRHYIVQDVWPGAVEPSQPPMHRVRLEALDDDQVGETLDVIWEHEVNCRVHDALGLPRPDAWDPMPRFEAFLLASRWSLSSVLMGLPLQAPFRGAIQIEDYQLEPVVRALRMPRVNLLIADDVGLGKTIEAGMVMQELLARQRIRRILVLCPASLQRQWAEEMLTKFALRFEIVDRDYIQKLRREYGIHVNPWASYPRLITSMDFLKREAPLQSFLASLHKERAGGLRDWDLLVVDEAHNAAPTGRTTYVRDSDRTHLLRQILGHFEHRLFLTATPHNGFTESFTAMLEMLDPLRFSRGPTVNKEQLAEVMVRRLKDDMVDSLGRRRFPVRHVDPLPAVVLSREERRLLDGLDQYIEKRLRRSGKMDRLPVQFALTLLKKRLLSSPLAFYRSIQVHRSHIETDQEASEEDARVVLNLKERLDEDFSDDEEKDRIEETAHAEAAGFFQVTGEEMGLVVELVNLAGPAAEREDSKFAVLLDFIESHLLSDGRWNQERLLVFTEYKDTLTYLTSMLQKRGWGERVLVLHGGPATEQIATVAGMAGEDTTGITRDGRVEPEQITTPSRVPGAENDATGTVRGRWV
ncbi:MAG: DISARM system SNF2-like helicase DrmD, partial [Bradymonadales bacterium]|nr:DISARM system SNF2-like helicase DrmD [Bradymonadales bacterium]